MNSLSSRASLIRSAYRRPAFLAPSAQLRRASSVTPPLADNKNFVRIVEVGPRDGLQNEKTPISVDDRATLINKLGETGLKIIEAGSFVSPKWVPQMAGTADVLTRMHRLPGVRYPVLVPNMKGLEALLSLLASSSASSTPNNNQFPPPTDEIAIFLAASNAFSKANINCTIAESITRIEPVVAKALEHGLRVRGYVSTVIACPYEGPIAPREVRDVAKAMVDMGCYEVSLGDTTGEGTPLTMRNMLESVIGVVKPEMLANHDTYGLGVANVLTALEAGIRTVDSSIAGLGGCPYSPGATGNVATEDIVHALHGSGYTTGVDLKKLVRVGDWVGETLLKGRRSESRAGRAWGVKVRKEDDERRKKLEDK
ncbi:aldolase [Clavulina sp. PMI_390]|nr:aldolase [Clavulina sp. PMI_390]